MQASTVFQLKRSRLDALAGRIFGDFQRRMAMLNDGNKTFL